MRTGWAAGPTRATGAALAAKRSDLSGAVSSISGQTNNFESASRDLLGYLRISTVSGFSRKLLQGLNRIGQFEMATICGIKARITM
jgi:hypothetical protein